MSNQEYINPYVGLRPFESDESLLFYGRRQQIPELLQKLYETRFLAVVGSSGCGKSSLIRAGLIPHLKAGFLVEERDKWNIVVMKPGNRPLYHLAESINQTVLNKFEFKENEQFYGHILASGIRAVIERLFLYFHETDANILLLVDQFEEIFRFTHHDSYEEAADFVSIILSLCKEKDLPVYTVLTMRSDFIGDCDRFYNLPEAMNKSQYLVPRMTREQRRQAIEGPASVYDIQIPEPLVQKLLNDSSENPDQLPVLQHALMRTWDKWKTTDDQLPDLKHYKSIGSVEEALSQHADEIFLQLSEPDQYIAEKLFKALTTQDNEGRGIRRNTPLKELCEILNSSTDNVIPIIDKFRDPSCSFLVPPLDKELQENSEVDISHESLMRVWKRLVEWVSQEADSAKRYKRIAETAVLYEKDEAVPLSGPELQIAEKWQKDNQPNESWANRYHPGFELSMKFLEISIKKRQEEDLKKRQFARNKNILRFVLVALLVLTGFSIFTVIQYREVEKARKEAVKAREITENALIQEEEQRKEANLQRKIAMEQKQKAELEEKKTRKQLEEILKLKDTLNPLAGQQGRLYVKIIPDDAKNAKITIDKIKQEYTDGIKLNAGSYEIHIRHENYYPKKINVPIKAGVEKQVSIELKPLPGTISINVKPEDAIVFLNSSKKGIGNIILKDLKPDKYKIQFKKDGYETKEKEIELGPNQTYTLEESLIKYAKLTIIPIPEDAKIRIMNIKPVYNDGINLLPDRYHIEISKKGYITFDEWISLDEGAEKKMDIVLKEIEKKSEKYITNELGMKFVYIKPGKFIMGSPKNEPGRFSRETQHNVILTKDFYMQTTEVTQGQWEKIMGSNPSEFQGCGKNCPVERVSWNDVQEYIKKLNSKDAKYNYRLPTEAEWEYAARAGTTSAIYTGDIEIKDDCNAPSLDNIAWYCGNSCVKYKTGYNCSTWNKKYGKQSDCKLCGTHPVGQKKPNNWGLYDMLGNVYEWCGDVYEEYPNKEVIDPFVDVKTGSRVFRGGGWFSLAGNCRSAYRNWYSSGFRYHYLGFRLVFSRGQ